MGSQSSQDSQDSTQPDAMCFSPGVESSSCLRHSLDDFGHFDDDDDGPILEAKNTWVLVLHYQFSDDDDWRRDGNQKDVENLAMCFGRYKNCCFKAVGSMKKESVLQTLSNNEEFIKLFSDSEQPAVFLLFIMTHGDSDGQLCTDTVDPCLDQYECFTTSEIIKRLGELSILSNVLKSVFFVACRGNVRDRPHVPRTIETLGNKSLRKNKKTCRIKQFPAQDNFVIVYASVESTASYRETLSGTWLIQSVCERLQNLKTDEALEVFLSKVLLGVHNKSTAEGYCIDYSQTPEIIFTPCKRFFVKKTVNDVDKATKTWLINPEHSGFFDWKSQKGSQLRRRLAGIFYDVKSKKCEDLASVLQKKLEFETYSMENSKEQLQSFKNLAQGPQSEFGCLLVCFLGSMYINSSDDICIKFREADRTIGEVVHYFIGPRNEKWIGRPKFFFFVQQSTTTDYVRKKIHLKEFEIRATNHSGWFVQVLPHTAFINGLINLFKNTGLRDGEASVQELALNLMIPRRNVSPAFTPKIATTLQYLVNFPKVPLTFLPPKLELAQRVPGKDTSPNKETIEFEKLCDVLVEEFEQGKDRNQCVYLISAEAGAGKSTILAEISHYLSRKIGNKIIKTAFHDEIKIFEKSRNVEKIFRSFTEKNKEWLVKATIKALEEKDVLFILDGFDEICPVFQKHALCLIESIADQKLPLVIATRPEEEENIEGALSEKYQIKKIFICPLDRRQQKKLLKLKGKLSNSDIPKFLQKLSAAGAKEMLQNPLQLDLISQLYHSNQSEKLNLYELYDKVIENYLNKTCLKKNLDDDTYKTNLRLWTESLQRFAVQQFCQDSAKIISNDEMSRIGKSGVVTVINDEDNNPIEGKFEHQTFAEFLLAQKFVNELIAGKDPTVTLLTNQYFPKSVEFIDSFLKLRNKQGETPGSEEDQEADEPVFSKEEVELFAIKLKEYCLNSDDFFNVLSNVIKGKHTNIFHLLKPNITFAAEENSDSKVFIEDGSPLILQVCGTNSDKGDQVGVKLIKMGALRGAPEDFSFDTLVLEIAKSGCLHERLFNTVLDEYPEKLGLKEVHLRIAAEHGNVRLLREILNKEHINANKPDSRGETALHKASKGGHVPCINELLKRKAKINAIDSFGQTALHLAARNGHEGAAKSLLQKGANCALQNKDGNDAFDCAVRFGNVDTLKVFLKTQARLTKNKIITRRDYLFGLALENPEFGDVFSFLIENSGSQKFINNFGQVVLVKVFKMDRSDKFEIASKILKAAKRCDFNSPDSDGNTLLHKYVKCGDINVVQFLLQHGAQIEKKTKDGSTPFLLATNFSGVRMCKYLVKCDANKYSVDEKLNNCIHRACFANSLKNLEYLFSLEKIESLLANKNEEGKTILHVAAEKCSVNVLTFLAEKLETQAFMEQDKFKRWMPIQFAIKFNSLNVIEYLLDVPKAYGSLTHNKLFAFAKKIRCNTNTLDLFLNERQAQKRKSAHPDEGGQSSAPPKKKPKLQNDIRRYFPPIKKT
ncbi:uncharacterized protein LOC132205621 [Neocloeon triangulifer]|uniref:uncharacterized protein LOC132205621 n=1 Tax=Neocloeon triangulifer TaxID=2078957 RepID=UPI00286F48B7|nr:uncharacterized protein LOC132205621 [Neocloeon triangulifer]